MKICFLAPANSIHSFRWIKYFADKDHEVHWISMHPLDFNIPSNIKYYEFSHKNWFWNFFSIVKKVRNLIKKIQPEILHIHSVAVYGTVGILSGFHPVIATAWGSDILVSGRLFWRKPLLKITLKKVDLITCDADHLIETMKNLGITQNKIQLVYFGIDTKVFSPEKINKILKTSLELNGSVTVISLRNLYPIYNVELLIEAIPFVVSEYSKVKFIIAGSGSEKQKLEALALSKGIMSNVKFIGKIPNEKLPYYLRLSDIYVSTSLSDAGIASSTAEAMSCGLPVVVTDSGENRIWVKENKGGFVVPVNSPEKLAQRILALIRDKKMRLKYGRFNRQMILENNNYYTQMNMMEKIYKNVYERNN